MICAVRDELSPRIIIHCDSKKFCCFALSKALSLKLVVRNCYNDSCCFPHKYPSAATFCLREKRTERVESADGYARSRDAQEARCERSTRVKRNDPLLAADTSLRVLELTSIASRNITNRSSIPFRERLHDEIRRERKGSVGASREKERQGT